MSAGDDRRLCIPRRREVQRARERIESKESMHDDAWGKAQDRSNDAKDAWEPSVLGSLRTHATRREVEIQPRKANPMQQATD